ncbi:MAG: response regulator [Eubacteriales bacterium]|nr:response regulator [Eubacteriales bacterium]
MYRVIVADDEESERSRILKMLEGMAEDFIVVGCYENGFDALENGIPLEPDVLITDIRMPYIDGIELIKEAKIELPLLQSIIISGYDSFDDAQKAISLGVIRYLSKPILASEMKEALEEAKKNLSALKETPETKEQVSTENAIRKDNDLSLLITMKNVPEDFFLQCKQDGIDLEKPYQRILLFDSDLDSIDPRREESLRLEIRECYEEEFSEPDSAAFFDGTELVAFFLSEKSVSKNEISARVREILARLERRYHLSVSCGISEESTKPVNYRKLYRHAKRTLEYRTVLGPSQVFLFEDLEKEENTSPSGGGKVDENEYKKLTYLISYGKEEETKKSVHNLVEQISSIEYKDNYYFILSSILDSILKACVSLGALYESTEPQTAIMTELYGLKSKQAITDFFDRMISAVISVNKSNRLNGLVNSFSQIQDFLKANYTNSGLSIDDVANELGYSVSYISSILKKNGTSFTKTVTDLRIKKATEILHNPDAKILSVANQVGYSDPYYFSHVFKKLAGMSPEEYRKKNVGTERE